MEKFVFKGLRRTDMGTRAARREREQGRIPAVVYGREGQETVNFTFDRADVEKMMRSHIRLVELELDDGMRETGLIRDIQFEPVTDQILHMDLVHIDLTKKVDVQVELEFIGHPRGLTAGGKFTHDISDLPVNCLPTAIPESIPVRVGHLEVGQSVKVADLDLPPGVTCTLPGEATLCHVKAFIPVTEEEEEVAPEGEQAEPEIITKRTEAEEGEG
jgi:large subunit ribosomal protein L25